MLVFEVFVMFCLFVGFFLLIYNMCGGMLNLFGFDVFKDKFFFDFCVMNKVFFYCLIESGFGFDVLVFKICVQKINVDYVFNGIKVFIFGGSYLDVYVVMCCMGEDGFKGILIVVVEDGMSGFFFGVLEKKMGWFN